MNYTLYNGDCLELMNKIEDKSIDLILADHPYATTHCEWDCLIPFDEMWKQINRIIKDESAIVLFGQEPFSSKLRCSNLDMWRYDWIWEKEQGFNFFNCKIFPYKVHEIISVFSKQKHNYYPQMEKGLPYISGKGQSLKLTNPIYKTQTINEGTRYLRSVLKFNTEKSKSVHPCQKPIKLLMYLIQTYTKENEIVLDFCFGSGSCGVACVNTNRDFVGIEKDENYFKIGKERIEKAKENIFDL